MIQFDYIYFSDGLGQPPTSHVAVDKLTLITSFTTYKHQITSACLTGIEVSQCNPDAHGEASPLL